MSKDQGPAGAGSRMLGLRRTYTAEQLCTIVADYECDVELATELLGKGFMRDESARFRFLQCDINWVIAAEERFLMYFDITPERCRHNALDDAFALRSAWLTGDAPSGASEERS